MFYLKFKRFMDIILSSLGLVLLSPVFAIIIIFIKLDSKGPAFFVQERCGINKTTFKLIKFRTMRVCTPKNCPTFMLDNHEQYITKVGSFLRKTSLDELPQIVNILKGDMSIVGPRPVIHKEVRLIKERDKYGANDVLPGLTGLAQINGRDTVKTVDKARYDGYYVENMGLKMDTKCFFGTVISVLRRDGVFEGRIDTFKEYKSSKKTCESEKNS